MIQSQCHAWNLRRTLWIILEDMDVAVAIRDDDVELLPVREEIRSHYFEVESVFAE